MRFAKLGFKFGLKRPLEVRVERIGDPSVPCRLAYISDIHLRRGRSGMLSNQVLEALEVARPHLILLGGDLVDQASEVDALSGLVQSMLHRAPVFAIPGNHDIAVGGELVRAVIKDCGAHWLLDADATFQHGDRSIGITAQGGRMEQEVDVRVLCAHSPWIWRSVKNAEFDLVLAGHLHGCQGVLFEAGGRLFPGACFFPHNVIRQEHRSSRLIVSRGCSDLLPVRWGCPREIVLCIL